MLRINRFIYNSRLVVLLLNLTLVKVRCTAFVTRKVYFIQNYLDSTAVIVLRLRLRMKFKSSLTRVPGVGIRYILVVVVVAVTNFYFDINDESRKLRDVCMGDH